MIMHAVRPRLFARTADGFRRRRLAPLADRPGAVCQLFVLPTGGRFRRERPVVDRAIRGCFASCSAAAPDTATTFWIAAPRLKLRNTSYISVQIPEERTSLYCNQTHVAKLRTRRCREQVFSKLGVHLIEPMTMSCKPTSRTSAPSKTCVHLDDTTMFPYRPLDFFYTAYSEPWHACRVSKFQKIEGINVLHEVAALSIICCSVDGRSVD